MLDVIRDLKRKTTENQINTTDITARADRYTKKYVTDYDNTFLIKKAIKKILHNTSRESHTLKKYHGEIKHGPAFDLVQYVASFKNININRLFISYNDIKYGDSMHNTFWVLDEFGDLRTVGYRSALKNSLYAQVENKCRNLIYYDKAIFKSDYIDNHGSVCMKCGRHVKELHGHHNIPYFSSILQDFLNTTTLENFDFDRFLEFHRIRCNLTCLCADCHIDEHKEIDKSCGYKDWKRTSTGGYMHTIEGVKFTVFKKQGKFWRCRYESADGFVGWVNQPHETPEAAVDYILSIQEGGIASQKM